MIGSNEKLCRDTGWEVGIPIELMLEDLMKHWELKVTDSIS
jgi:hypothetical protein